MKLDNLSVLGALLMAVAGGCAHMQSTAVSYRPVSNGQEVDVSLYDLDVGGQLGARVAFLPARATREQAGQQLVIVPVRIDNRSARTLSLPTAQLHMITALAAQIPPVQLDGTAVPEVVIVKPGESRTVEIGFRPPLEQTRRSQLLVSWLLDIEGAAPITRVTAFSPPPTGAFGAANAASDLPAMSNLRQVEQARLHDRVFTDPRQIGGQRRAQAQTPGLQ